MIGFEEDQEEKEFLNLEEDFEVSKEDEEFFEALNLSEDEDLIIPF